MPESHEKVSERDQIYQELRNLAAPHVERSAGTFELLPIQPDLYPAQKITNSRIRGNPQDTGTIALIASAVEPRFPQMTDHLAELEDSHGEISRLGEAIKSGQNVLLVTNHGDIKDIAFVLSAFYNGLKSRDYSAHSSLVMSKILSFFGVRLGESVTPAVDLLKNVCDIEYFSFPQTASIQESKIDSGLRLAYNKQLRHAMQTQLRRGSNLFAMAASGTTDKPLADDPSTISLATLTSGTMKLITTGNSLVLPVAVWLQGKQLVFEPADIPRVIPDESAAHEVMKKLARTLSESVDGHRFAYKTPSTSS